MKYKDDIQHCISTIWYHSRWAVILLHILSKTWSACTNTHSYKWQRKLHLYTISCELKHARARTSPAKRSPQYSRMMPLVAAMDPCCSSRLRFHSANRRDCTRITDEPFGKAFAQYFSTCVSWLGGWISRGPNGSKDAYMHACNACMHAFGSFSSKNIAETVFANCHNKLLFRIVYRWELPIMESCTDDARVDLAPQKFQRFRLGYLY